jgi:hypothetical protein
MAENVSNSNNNGLYFIVGSLVVIVGVLGFFLLGGRIGGGRGSVDVTIAAPAAPGQAPARP